MRNPFNYLVTATLQLHNIADAGEKWASLSSTFGASPALTDMNSPLVHGLLHLRLIINLVHNSITWESIICLPRILLAEETLRLPRTL